MDRGGHRNAKRSGKEIAQAARPFERARGRAGPREAPQSRLLATSRKTARQRVAGKVGGMHYRSQPAILLAQFARADDTPGIGEEMLQHADGSARRALPYVGATVLVVDPFDQDTADMWRQRFGFQDSEQPVPGNRRLRRQWLSLQQ
jgi:hypothetical protein